jgi:hypothetical protein
MRTLALALTLTLGALGCSSSSDTSGTSNVTDGSDVLGTWKETLTGFVNTLVLTGTTSAGKTNGDAKFTMVWTQTDAGKEGCITTTDDTATFSASDASIIFTNPNGNAGTAGCTDSANNISYGPINDDGVMLEMAGPYTLSGNQLKILGATTHTFTKQ